MAVEIANSGKRILLEAADDWSECGPTHVVGHFNRAGLLIPFIDGSSSTVCASHYDDLSCDFIFIDASHDYESVRADLDAWLPKLRARGVIGGHDYRTGAFPGVTRAVDEFFAGSLYRVEHRRNSWLVRL
jgi:hypothetical protein